MFTELLQVLNSELTHVSLNIVDLTSTYFFALVQFKSSRYILGIIFFIAITIAVLHSVKSCVDTNRASQIQNSTLYLYINDKPVCRGLQGFNGHVYSFTCSDGTKYKGLTNFYTRNHK